MHPHTLSHTCAHIIHTCNYTQTPSHSHNTKFHSEPSLSRHVTPLHTNLSTLCSWPRRNHIWQWRYPGRSTRTGSSSALPTPLALLFPASCASCGIEPTAPAPVWQRARLQTNANENTVMSTLMPMTTTLVSSHRPHLRHTIPACDTQYPHARACRDMHLQTHMHLHIPAP